MPNRRTDDTDESDTSRRDYVKGLGVLGLAGATGLAGCTGDQTGGTPTETEDTGGGGTSTDTATPTDTTTQMEKLGDTLVDPDGNQVSLKLVYSSGSQTTKTMMQYIKQELAGVGIKVELSSMKFNEMLVKYAQNSPPNKDKKTFNAGSRDKSVSPQPWDMMGGIGFNSYPRTPTAIKPFWSDVSKKEASVNFYGYKPSEPILPKLNEASTTTDDQKRQELLSTVFGIISRDQPTNFLTFDKNLSGYRKRVKGLGEPGPAFGYDAQTRYFSNGSGSPQVKGTYTSGSSSDAKTLNPIRINDTSSANRVGLTMDGAYTIDNNNEFVGRWVEEVDDSDNQNYTFYLRDNLEWGAGYGQMTAEDWVYYIKNVRQADTNWAGDVNHSDWFRNGEAIPVEKTGKLSFEVQLPKIDPFFVKKPIMWGAYCMPKGLIEKYRPDPSAPKKEQTAAGDELNKDPEVTKLKYTGNLGPYTFERWDRDSVFVASRNDDYYAANTVFDGDVPYFKQNNMQVFSEESTRLSALKTGSIDATGIPPRKFQSFEQNPDVKTVKTPTAFCNMLVYNQRANGWDPMRKQEVRQALSTAVSKQVIVEQINRGLANIAYTHQPEWSNWFNLSKVTKFGGPNSYSKIKAQHMLDDALSSGYKFE